MKTKSTPLQKAIKKLMESYSSNEILTNLISETERQVNTDENEWLLEEMIFYMTINKGMNLVKAETLSQQYEIEEALTKIIPYYSDQQTNLHLSY
jgi:hypothetical protein